MCVEPFEDAPIEVGSKISARRPTAGSSPADRRSRCAPFPRLGAWDVAGRAGAASPGASASVVMTSGSLWGDQPDTDAALTRNS